MPLTLTANRRVRFADLRQRAGVRRHSIRRPTDDAHFVVIDLDFDTSEEARAFLDVLEQRIWSSADNAPALVGTPRTRILDSAEDLEAAESDRV